MANTYSQVHLQFVFATRYRKQSIQKAWKDELYKYITAIIQNNGHKLLAINGMPDHVHILVGFRTNQSIADLMREVKANSSKWINEKHYPRSKFEWQSGYGVFSYCHDTLPRIAGYIHYQEQHHLRQ